MPGEVNVAITNSSGCVKNITKKIEKYPDITPIFNNVESICLGTPLTQLPTTSLNGIVGTWSPILDNTVTTTYTFEPNSGQCSTNVSLTITVLQPSDPTCNDCQPNLTLSSPEVNTTIIYKRQNWIETNSNYVTSNNQNITMRAADYINLKPNTHIVSGSVFQAKIEDCSVIPKTSSSIEDELNSSKLPEGERIDFDLESIIIYPNPTNDIITISGLNMKVKSILINSMEGKIIHLSNPTKNSTYMVDLSNYQEGIYLLRIETLDGRLLIKKLIKN